MAKSEIDFAHTHSTTERRPRIDHERNVILSLADPGQVDKNGVLKKSTHKEIAERLYQKQLSRPRGRVRDIRLAAATQSVREIGKRFINRLTNLFPVKDAAFTRSTALFEEIRGLYSDRSLEPMDLYEIFGLSQIENHGNSSESYLNIVAPPLPQPETDPERRKFNGEVLGDHLLFIRNNPEPKPLGTK